jgi:hypothetical protein
MNKSLTEHVLNIGKEFDEKFGKISHIHRGECAITDITGHIWPAYTDESGKVIEVGGLKSVKAFILDHQLKTIELLKEEIEEMRKERFLCGACTAHKGEQIVGHTMCCTALSQAIALLDTIIQEIKAQMK